MPFIIYEYPHETVVGLCDTFEDAKALVKKLFPNYCSDFYYSIANYERAADGYMKLVSSTTYYSIMDLEF